MEESKQCTQCKRTLLLEQFRMNKQTGQVTKLCIKCLDIAKKSEEKNKCSHGKKKSKCKACGGGSICEHQKRRCYCKECGGGSICEHQRIRSICKECKGVGICKHNPIKYTCKICGGNGICQHDKERLKCQECNPKGHLAHCVRSRIYQALKHNKEMHSVEYLGCNIEKFREHIELQFKEGMTWENHGEWHIAHKIPIAYKQDGISPTLEEVAKRLHYTNTQPLWASENMLKGNRYIS